jgi:hypothetical protein
MKVNISVDCTPEEARRFLGLPEVAGMQDRLIEALERRLAEAIDSSDTATLMQTWLPLAAKGLEQWQAVWGQLAGIGPPRAGSTRRKRPAEP